MTNALTLRDSLAPTSFGDVAKFAEMVAPTSFVPQAYRGKPGEIVAAVIYGADLGFTPMQALQNIAVVNGKPSVYGDGLRALILGRADCEGVEDGHEGTGDDYGAFVVVRRKGKTPVRRTFTIRDARAAGLLDKSGPWKQYRDRMMLMRAQGFAIRDAYADVLRGVITTEEAADYPAMKDVTPAPAWSHPATTIDSPSDAIDAETGEVIERPDWHAEIVKAEALSVLNAVAGRMREAKAGTPELRALFAARKAELVEPATDLLGDTPQTTWLDSIVGLLADMPAAEVPTLLKGADTRRELAAVDEGRIIAASKKLPGQVGDALVAAWRETR